MANYADYRIVFTTGEEVEITHCQTYGVARMLAVEYMTNTKRKNRVIAKVFRMKEDPERHRVRRQEARHQAMAKWRAEHLH